MFDIHIIVEPINLEQLKSIAGNGFGILVKAVADIEKKILALGSELHVDEETLLIEQGSEQSHLWGFNIYPDKSRDTWIEFDSMVNIRPNDNNFSRNVENIAIQNKIREIVKELIQ